MGRGKHEIIHLASGDGEFFVYSFDPGHYRIDQCCLPCPPKLAPRLVCIETCSLLKKIGDACTQIVKSSPFSYWRRNIEDIMSSLLLNVIKKTLPRHGSEWEDRQWADKEKGIQQRAQIPARDLTWDTIPRHLSQIIVIVQTKSTLMVLFVRLMVFVLSGMYS